MTVQDDDQLLVSRNTTPYNLKSQNVMAELLDDDLMVVCRNGTPYKATGLEIKESIGPQEAPPSLVSVTLTEDSPGGDRFDNQSFTSTLNWATKGVPEASVEMKATVTGTLDIAGATDEIVGIEGSTSSFAPVLYTGNGSAQSITGVGFKPGLLWIKDRSIGNDHNLNTVSLFDDGKYLVSNSANGASDINGVYVTSIDDDGFSVGAANAVNGSGYDFVAWCWDAGDTTVTNNDGEITSQVRSNGDFSVVKYTGNLSVVGSATVGSGLNKIPAMIITKSTNSTSRWCVQHKNLPQNYLLSLNTTDQATDFPYGDLINDSTTTFPTNFTTGMNTNGDEFIAYCWAESPTQSFGSYSGSGSVDCGFEPAFLMLKTSASTGDWIIVDDARNPSNPRNLGLFPNGAGYEQDASSYVGAINFTSTGFSAAGGGSQTGPYIYAAFGAGTANTTLTLASDANLANGAFKAGDEVKQNNSPIVPTSSPITNVGETTSDYRISYNPDNRNEWLPGTNVFLFESLTFPFQMNSIADYLPGFDGTCDYSLFTSDSTTSGWEKVNNYTISETVQSANEKKYISFIAYNVSPTPSVGQDVLQLKPNFITPSLDTVLTLQDASGLSEFEVGDKVTGYVATDISVTAQTNGANTLELFEIAWNDPGNVSGNCFLSTAVPGDYIEFKVPQAGSLILNGGRGGSPAVDVDITATGDFTGGDRDFQWVSGSTSQTFNFTDAGVVRLTVTNSAGGIYINNTDSTFNGATFTFAEPVVVTAIDEAAPSITTDGGTWSTTPFDTTDAAIMNEWIINVDFTSTIDAKDLTYNVDTAGGIEIDSNTTLITQGGLISATCDKPFNTYYSDNGTYWTLIDAGLSGGTVVNYTGHLYFAMNPQQFQDSSLECQSLIISGVNIVTGPAKPITATFVSADPSVPSMTVSDVVGPWSSSTGNFVVNTVVNPIMIKPETSAITGVGFAPDYADNAETTKTVLDGSVPQTYSTLDNLFDGDTTTAYNVDYVATGGTNEKVRLTFNTPINYSSSVELFVSSYSTDSTYWASINGGAGQRGGTGVIASGEWVTFGTGPGVLSSIEIGSYNGGNYSSISGIRVDGGMLISGATVLNLTDDTDLNQFATGDAVYAGGDAAPVTFAPVIYTGNGAEQEITTGFATDLVWIKSRTAAYNHCLLDTLRGTNSILDSNSNIEPVVNSPDAFTSFNADGFTLGANSLGSRGNETNLNGGSYVAWCWGAGDTTVTNNDGEIASQVRSNGSFSIVSYDGVSTTPGSATVGHGLNTEPSLIIIKNTTTSEDWVVYTKPTGNGKYMKLNIAYTTITSDMWGNTSPTSSVFSVGYSSQANLYGNSYIAYCWAESDTQSIGQYTGNGSTDGPVINCGFEPAFVLIKSSMLEQNWEILDPNRSGSLYADLESVEAPGNTVNYLSNGFKVTSNGSGANSADEPYIYIAFASSATPTGVVGDITGLDMTLSESTGAWEVGQTVTMDEKPAVSTTANLIFNSTGAVSGLTTADVPGQLVSNKDTPKLTFADGPGTGETWDEELPAGTHLRTSFVATNVEGTTSGTSNEITP